MSIKTFLSEQTKLWLLNDKGEISKTKCGIAAAAVSGAILSFPTTAAVFGVAVVLPPVAIAIAKYAGIIGLALAGVRAKNAIDESKKK